MDIVEGNLTFSFYEKVDALKFDDSHFYRHHFIKLKNNIKAVDIIAVDKKVAYFIEIKDYTHPNTNNINQRISLGK